MDIKTAKAADTDSLNSSFVSVSPTPSITTTTEGMPEDEPPPYSAIEHNVPTQSWGAVDPRSSSTQSLVPSPAAHDGRRKLLLVYIHGFMGNETSFQSFPAHVHNVISMLLAESHIVHTKIYPRYRSKKAIQVATADFSAWLNPHLTSDTDIVLLGHSMGGLLSAELVLMPSVLPESDSPLKHRVLGTISFDTPFLGMHPGVVRSGLGSLFRAAPTPPPTSPESAMLSPSSSISSGQQLDPNYNPAFTNDVNLPIRKGWGNALHFITKHSKNLRQATTQLVTSHIEFGSCLADFDGLKVRYCRIRMLDEDDEQKRKTVVENTRPPPRVRFINYYTASTGRPKKPKPEQNAAAPTDIQQNALTSSSRPSLQEKDLKPPGSAPPSYAGHDDDFDDDHESIDSSIADLDELDPMEDLGTAEYTESNTSLAGISPHSTDTLPLEKTMPELPAPPGMPPFPQNYPDDPKAFKAAQKAYVAECKGYGAALKDYHKTLAAYRKAEAQRLRAEQKAALDVAAEERKIELELRIEENKRIAEAGDADTRKAEIEAMRERRKREFDLRRDQLKRSIEDEKERRKIAADKVKAEKKAGKKAVAQEVKTYKKDVKQAKKMQKRGTSSCSSHTQRDDSFSERGESSVSGFESSIAPVDEQEQGYFDSVAMGSPSSPTPPNAATSFRNLNANGYPEDIKRDPSLPSLAATDSSSIPGTVDTSGKPRKDKRFCILPPKDAAGNPDPTWHRVFMEGVDEVGAHCGLFFPRGEAGTEHRAHPGDDWGARYTSLVNDVAQRVELWVLDDMTERTVRAVGEM